MTKMNRNRYYYVYISTNKGCSVLYTGVTNNLLERDVQHKRKIKSNSFTVRYNINKIVYYETFMDILEALTREKQIKGGSRDKKINLIKSINPLWENLIKI